MEVIGVSSQKGFVSGIGVDTSGAGDAGTLKINTGRLIIRDGAQLGSGTSGSGYGGNTIVNARESVEIIGQGPVGASSLNSNANYANGDAGNLTIDTEKLIVRDGANVSVNTFQSRNFFRPSTGAAGNLQITSRAILLDNQGVITAGTFAGSQGNITVKSDALQMRHGSKIETNAFGTANGGNITLNTNTLVALENSDIRANAIRGQGGNIQVKAPGIFRSLDSAIDASSQLGINGVVKINPIDNPTRSITTLKAKIEAQNSIQFNGCIATGKPVEGKFSITGSGGLPSTPGEALSSNPVLDDLGTTGTSANNFQPTSMVEAQALVKTPDGRFLLIASMPNSCQ